MKKPKPKSALDRLLDHQGRNSIDLNYATKTTWAWRITIYWHYALIRANGRTPEEAARNALRQIEGNG